MAGTTKHTSISRISKDLWGKCSSSNPSKQFTLRNLMVNMQSIATLAVLCFLSAAFALTPPKLNNGLTPPVIGFGPAAQPVRNIGMLPSSVSSNKLWDTNGRTLHHGCNTNELTTATSTNVFPLVIVNPLDSFSTQPFTSEVVTMNVPGNTNRLAVFPAANDDQFAASTGAQLSSVVGNPLSDNPTWWFHNDLLKMISLASGELLEPLPGNAEGNQQPSQQYTAGRFRDYWRGSALLITSWSARVSRFHTRHDIVRTPEKSREKFVNDTQDPKINFNGLHFNSAVLMKSRYAPGTYVSGTNDPIATTYMKQMSNGALVAYPTVLAETLWWLNARKPYANMYISNDPEYGLGFTGFKPAQGNTKVAGQVLFAGAVTFAPRYHKQLYGITG